MIPQGSGTLKIKYFALILALTTILLAKDMVIKDTQVLLSTVNTPFYFPAYTIDGESILLTQNAYTGLWILNRSSEELRQITSVQGAGYQPRSLSDGTVIYRQDEYQKGRKFTSLYKADASGNHLIAEGARFVSPANMVDHRMLYLIDETPTILNAITGQRERNLADYTTVLNDKLSLKLFKAGEQTILAPQGQGNYIWSELSPSGDMVVYTMTGQGTFVCDLEGKVIADLGDAHAAQWSPDGKYIAYMQDLDDGSQYTESEIWIVSYDGHHAWKITDTPDIIEMYPQWAPDGQHVIYHSLQGEIMETSFEIVE